jgi:hypothetical protein
MECINYPRTAEQKAKHMALKNQISYFQKNFLHDDGFQGKPWGIYAARGMWTTW